MSLSLRFYMRCPLCGLATGALLVGLMLWPARASVVRAWLHT